MKVEFKKKYRQLYRNIIKVLPTKLVLNIENFRGYHKFVDFKNPRYFGEKIQWLKLYGNLEKYSDYVDKYKVREYIEKKIGKKYLIPLLNTYDKASDIDFGILPNKFVLKINTGSGYNFIVNDKNKANFKELKKRINSALREDYFKIKKEFQYKNISKKILCEKYMCDKNGQLLDYKFFCFNGIVEFTQVDYDRFTKHKRNFFDRNGNLMELQCGDYEINDSADKLPNNYDKMILIAEKLSKEFQFVRVDLYNIDGRIYFGELTFTPTGGLKPFRPLEKDIEIAKKITTKKTNTILYVCSMGEKSKRLDGVTIKSKTLLDYMKKLDVNCNYVDVDNYKKRFFLIVFSILKKYRKSDKIVICSSSRGASILLSFLRRIKCNKDIYYFVAGGVFGEKLKKGIYKKKNYLNLKKIYVESDEMLNQLLGQGLTNVKKIINFRNPVEFSNNYKKEKNIKFVTWGRVIPEKGIDDAIEIINRLNKEGYDVALDIIGQCTKDYKKIIQKKCNDKIKYIGQITPNGKTEYEVLSKYDIFLFPTHYYYEGLPGAIIDAYISGLAIIAYDWIYAKEYVFNNKNGYVSKFNDIDDMYLKVKNIIDSNKIYDFKLYSIKKSKRFYTYNILKDFKNELLR